jgi:uncharacterized protein (TIGR03437 family)
MYKAIFLLCVATVASPAQTLTNVVNFNGGNGAGPTSGLILASDGNYYGTTGSTIYKLTPAGVLTTIYSFVESGVVFPGALIQGVDGNLYGTTGRGGPGGAGTIFKTTPSGVLTTLYGFTLAEGSPTGLTQASDGNFYGTTSAGTAGTLGGIFRITPAGALTVLYTFTLGPTDENGWDPDGMVQGADGNFYGVTGLGGGPLGAGTIFKITPTGVLTILYSFTGPDGRAPGPLIQGSDGNFYGITSEGGSSGNGTVFNVTPAGVLTTLHSFSGSEGFSPTGALLQAGDGNFYGTTQYGGSGFGTIFELTPAGALTTLHNFTGNTPSGIEPNGNLIQGSDGRIYGTTQTGGGPQSAGIIFALSVGGLVQPPAVTTGTASSATNNSAILSSSVSADGAETLAWFQYSVNSSMAGSVSTTKQDVGSAPGPVSFTTAVSGLLADTTYYFQAFASNSAGTSSGSIAPFTTAGAAVYNISGTVLLSGAGLSGVRIVLGGSQGGTDITDSAGDYSFDAPSGGNYTVTPGANGYAFIPPSLSFTNLNGDQVASFTAIVSAPIAAPITLATFNGTNGASPSAGLIQASDGNFYGTTRNGGANNLGTIFQVTPSGTLTTLHSFSGTDGSNPAAGLLQASNGNFYGTAKGGGAAGFGTVYQITPAGSLTTLQSFGQNNGAYPDGALIQANDGNLYGTTSGSGAFYPATVFRLTPAGTLTTLYPFAYIEGNGPAGGLLQGSDGNLYGTLYGGPGMVFKLTPSGALTALYVFCAMANCADGSSPDAALVLGADGNFYGTTALGGANGAGVVFKLTPAGTLTVLHSFDVADGESPDGLLLATDGNFYGTTSIGGASGYGTIFQMTPAGALTTLQSFAGSDGAVPQGPLIQAPDGSLYGTTQGSGGVGQGTVFSLALPISGPAIYPSSGLVNGASFQSGITANSWITILGTNLSSKTDTWAGAIVNGVLPPSLDGVSVSVGGQPAYIAYVSPGQINALAPNISPGNLSVTVSNGSVTSPPSTAVAQIYQPAFFEWGSYAVATRTDYSLAVKNGTFPGMTTVPAKPGDTIILWGTGFGPTTPAAAAGMVVPSGVTYNTATPVMVSVGGTTAIVFGAALTPGDAGLYQIAIQIPTTLADGDYPVVATVSGVQSPLNVLITVQ